MQILEEKFDESERKLRDADTSLELFFSIRTISRESGKKKGAKSWYHSMWELIIKQLARGTPPSAVNKNIVADVHDQKTAKHLGNKTRTLNTAPHSANIGGVLSGGGREMSSGVH